ncbi:23S rRNA (uracil(1939)-C(5))-methyltransferase RlmD [Conexibacter sp. JD483]|uniref:23S rRNA (uracil(1939)-C(5))-methyltransferase RlmD n=1 Tax=unclassified Conexibacter TaxID=2627773 RepID=UPI002727E360|nr:MULTISPECIES: 23S rRNA (uracil(1939)-C(5))-methyltransferase RlmD [unclassified Conexibacter]MDO8187019.1 23S rRNA (uracil(1939)-C(5))-methyltransferase RlmD [Conexibacter sp. CPCC 205706]MDO8200663.1 23S rRNA (uracil(1939)-C(5))-methyltransferase RlmD [Conexibacter sp. CPCC 205762]MDR9371601.1 23S rRNA (uracil(1939)-C(5))-methyltransferase RlmD [Conexibacter sp. JD483]
MSTPSTTQRKRPDRFAELEVTIDSLAFGGNGVARHDGYVLFVQGAIPGDRVRVKVTKTKRDYGEAITQEVLEPSPDRIAAVAQHPGAPWQVLPYEKQLEIKSQQVDDALRRIGKLAGYELEPIVPALQTWRYRNKLEYSFGTEGTAERGELIFGFHAPGEWDRIVPIDDCLLASEAGNAVREQVLRFCKEQGLEPYDRRTRRGFLRNCVVREGRRTGQFQVRLVTMPGELDEEAFAQAVDVDGLMWTQYDGLGETTTSGETTVISGREYLEEELNGMTFRVSPHAFFQVNTEMAEKLYGLAGEYAALAGFERLYDLYCGIGTIGLTMAPRAGELWGLEIVEPAVGDAIANARLNEIDNARFFAGDARTALRLLVEQAGSPDVVVVDPPRAGLSQKVVRRIIDASPKRIVYISCNPTTLAPNAAQLVEAGYVLRKVRPVDMFPQTPHIECVALLERA